MSIFLIDSCRRNVCETNFLFSKYPQGRTFHIFAEMLETDLFFNDGNPPDFSNVKWKHRLKSLAEIIFCVKSRQRSSNW